MKRQFYHWWKRTGNLRSTRQHLFCDGGCAGPNPAPAGTWAWIRVNHVGVVLRADSGTLTARRAGLDAVSNNVAELFAAMMGILQLPPSWAGTVWTDSRVTLLRLTCSESFLGVPSWIEERVRELRDGARWQVKLLGGHPTRAELEAGRRRDGKRVSEFNVLCDQRCRQLARKFLEKRLT